VEFSQLESIDMAEYGLLAEQNDLSLGFKRKACLSVGVTIRDVVSGDVLITWLS
jgi:hypothetical protein